MLEQIDMQVNMLRQSNVTPKLGCMLLFRVPFFFATKVTGTQEVTEFCSNSFPVDRKKEQLGLAGLDQKESKKEPKRKVITLILTLSQP